MNGQGSTLIEPPELVLDTNTVLDLWLFDDPTARPLHEALAAGRVRWIATERMRAELHGVLRRPRMGRWEPPALAERTLAAAERWMTLRPAPADGVAPRCRDVADQPFIDLAWAARAKWLLTRDKALLRLARAARDRSLWIGPPAAWSP